MTIGGILVGSYTYDPLDRRIGFNDNGAQTWVVWDGQNPYADFNGSGALQKRYLYGPAVDQILARTNSGGATAWYLTDRLGTVRDIVNTAGAVIDHLAYDSFGTVLSESSPSNGDRYKFTAREYDAATGQYFYRARYYDPATGRFTRPDPKGFGAEDADLYRYVGNNPTNLTDPAGTDWWGAAGGATVGGVIGGTIVGGAILIVTAPISVPVIAGGLVVGIGGGLLGGAYYGYGKTGVLAGAWAGIRPGVVAGGLGAGVIAIGAPPPPLPPLGPSGPEIPPALPRPGIPPTPFDVETWMDWMDRIFAFWK